MSKVALQEALLNSLFSWFSLAPPSTSSAGEHGGEQAEELDRFEWEIWKIKYCKKYYASKFTDRKFAYLFYILKE